MNVIEQLRKQIAEFDWAEFAKKHGLIEQKENRRKDDEANENRQVSE